MTKREFVEMLIKSAHENADTELVEVVRCKDCRFCAVLPQGDRMCSMWKEIISLNGFCYMGEKIKNYDEDY